MTIRHKNVSAALGDNGSCDRQGYDCPNPFSADRGRPAEACCGDFVTDMYMRAQVPLPLMQPGCWTGFAYWDGDGTADHTESGTGYRDRALFTIGGNSAPSNVDSFVGEGGVHQHRWTAPAGQGNTNVLVVVDASKVV